MGKHTLEKESAGPRRLVKAMSAKKLQLLMGAMEELYGEEAKDLSFAEVCERHPDLIAKLDNDDVESAIGVVLSSEQVDQLDRMIEVGTTVRDARDKVFGKAKKKV